MDLAEAVSINSQSVSLSVSQSVSLSVSQSVSQAVSLSGLFTRKFKQFFRKATFIYFFFL